MNSNTQIVEAEAEPEPNVVISIEPIKIDDFKTVYINENMYALFPSYNYCSNCKRFYGELNFDAYILEKNYNDDGSEITIRTDYYGEFLYKSEICKCKSNTKFKFSKKDYNLKLRKLDNNGYYTNNSLILEDNLSIETIKKIHNVAMGHSNIDYIVDPECLENSLLSSEGSEDDESNENDENN
jgi:hypothetical protein